jgi:hypothetical protein
MVAAKLGLSRISGARFKNVSKRFALQTGHGSDQKQRKQQQANELSAPEVEQCAGHDSGQSGRAHRLLQQRNLQATTQATISESSVREKSRYWIRRRESEDSGAQQRTSPK